ncbi:pilus assembly protein TadG-related protein [Seohaeicola nanhaiensis]|uniref:Pilus assembly protein TadG-related protein n=1 Tax=Seohaeicola nanhaiensis TaxID=1387282 RepID=A0ABV9KIB7_9RHOB
MAVQYGKNAARSFGLALGRKRRVRGALGRFCRDDEGSLIIFSVYILVLILMVAGIGIDLMRFERDRAELQYTLDRAVLAAADLEQTLDPASVVQDYFDKAGLGEYLTGTQVSEGLGYRTVSATARTEVKTQFMHMTGLDMITAPAAGTAEERIDGVEISLVLDVSGSMNSNSRLYNLKIAARDFIDTMVDNTEDGKMSISIIPYATQVSMPSSFINRLTTTGVNPYSNCINFSASDFNDTAVTTTQTLERSMHFDPWTSGSSDSRDGRYSSPSALVKQPVCEAMSSREMLIMQKDRTILKNFISNLSAGGNTSIDIGMKWGTALVDPAMRPVFAAMAGEGTIPADFAARPLNYDDQDILKVIVLMSDGENTSQYYIRPGYDGLSNIWWNPDVKEYSVWVPEYGKFYWPHNSNSSYDRWADHAYGQPYGDNGYGQSANSCVSSTNSVSSSYSCKNRTETGTSVRLSYSELWARTPLAVNVDKNYDPWMNDSTAQNTWNYGVRGEVNSSSKNSRTHAICEAAKAKDVIVFTIGFEAPYNGRTVLKDCASSDAHYFDVNGLEISEAFASIATSIRKLRLTQ